MGAQTLPKLSTAILVGTPKNGEVFVMAPLESISLRRLFPGHRCTEYRPHPPPDLSRRSAGLYSKGKYRETVVISAGEKLTTGAEP